MKKLTMLPFAMMAISCSDAPGTDLEELKAMEAQWQAGFDARAAAAIAAANAAMSRR